MANRNDNYSGISSLTSSSASLQLPKSFENVENANEIWQIIRKRFPKTAPLLNELEEAIDRAQSRVQSLNYQSSVISSTIDENDGNSLGQEDSIKAEKEIIDIVDNQSLKEWEGFGNCHYPSTSELTIEEATNQINKVKEICQVNSKLVENNFHETISTIISVVKSVEQESPEASKYLQPTITTKEAFFAPAQERISSCSSSSSNINNNNNDHHHQQRQQQSSKIATVVTASMVSPRETLSDKKSPSRIPKKTPRACNETLNPTTKSPTLKSINNKVSPRPVINLSQKKFIDVHQESSDSNNKSPRSPANKKNKAKPVAFSRFSKNN